MSSAAGKTKGHIGIASKYDNIKILSLTDKDMCFKLGNCLTKKCAKCKVTIYPLEKTIKQAYVDYGVSENKIIYLCSDCGVDEVLSCEGELILTKDVKKQGITKADVKLAALRHKRKQPHPHGWGF